MTVTLFAQPYDQSASGFYFDDIETYRAKAEALRNDYGDKVEEFEIQFIDGDEIDCAVAKALGLNQANLKRFLELIDEWEESQKLIFIIGVGEVGLNFDLDCDDHHNLDIDIYHVETIRELAEQFVDDGLFGDIPESISSYIDLDAIARDLSVDYAEFSVAGHSIIYLSY